MVLSGTQDFQQQAWVWGRAKQPRRGNWFPSPALSSPSTFLHRPTLHFIPPSFSQSLSSPSPSTPGRTPPPGSIMASPPLLPQIPAPTPLLGSFSSPLVPLALPQGPGYPGGPPASPARARAAGGAVGQPRASPPPRGDVTMPEPQSSWAGSAHSPVRTALIGRASAGRAGPVGGRTPSWPGLRLLSPRSGAPNRPGVPDPAPPPARRARPRPRAPGPGPAPGGGARLLRPLGARALCAEHR